MGCRAHRDERAARYRLPRDRSRPGGLRRNRNRRTLRRAAAPRRRERNPAARRRALRAAADPRPPAAGSRRGGRRRLYPCVRRARGSGARGPQPHRDPASRRRRSVGAGARRRGQFPRRGAAHRPAARGRVRGRLCRPDLGPGICRRGYRGERAGRAPASGRRGFRLRPQRLFIAPDRAGVLPVPQAGGDELRRGRDAAGRRAHRVLFAASAGASGEGRAHPDSRRGGRGRPRRGAIRASGRRGNLRFGRDA